MGEMTQDMLREMLLSERTKGNVVVLDHEGFHIGPVSGLVNQPADGLLYDLNRLEEVALTFLSKDSQWVNNFAVALVIRELKARIEALERLIDDIAYDALYHDGHENPEAFEDIRVRLRAKGYSREWALTLREADDAPR